MAKVAVPKPPKAKRDLPAPFKGGDRVLDRDEVVASTNQGPWSHADAVKHGYERGINLRESRDDWQKPKEYQAMTKRMIAEPPNMKEVERFMGRPKQSRSLGRKR